MNVEKSKRMEIYHILHSPQNKSTRKLLKCLAVQLKHKHRQMSGYGSIHENVYMNNIEVNDLSVVTHGFSHHNRQW